MISFTCRHFQKELILMAVRWFMAYSLHDYVRTSSSKSILGNYFYGGRMESRLYDETRKKVPKVSITLAMLVNVIGQLGGHLNRRHDGEPGPTVLEVGLQQLRDFIFAQQVYHQIRE